MVARRNADMGLIVSVRCTLLCGLLWGALWPSVHAAEESALRLSPAPGLTATARPEPSGAIAVLLPSGRQQRLTGVTDADGRMRLSAEDIDFDGHPELVARAAVGQVNEAVAVYRYDRAEARFTALEAATHSHDQCGGLMGLSVDAPNRTLSSSCRSGPMWYVDFYRFDGPQLYLYRAERMLMVDDALEAVVLVKQSADSGPLAVWSTYDPTGKVLETAIADGLDAPSSSTRLQAVSGRVVPERLPLYARPGDPGTRRYLVSDDRVELLDEADGWLQVRYDNPKRGAVLGWIRVSTP